MVGIAGGLAVYTPLRHTLGSADIALDTRMRDYGDDLAHNERVLKKALNYRGGVLGAIGRASTFAPYANAHPELLPANRTWAPPTTPQEA